MSGQGTAGRESAGSRLLPILLHELQAPQKMCGGGKSDGCVGCERVLGQGVAGRRAAACMLLPTLFRELQAPERRGRRGVTGV